MRCEYTEILEAMGEPKWWDENAVPRYVDFHPNHTANIYATEVVLLEIACQNCGHPFLVAMSQSNMDRVFKRNWELPGCFPPHYGDPPRLLGDECCPAGPTMNVDLIEVKERWQCRLREDPSWVKVDQFPFELDQRGGRDE